MPVPGGSEDSKQTDFCLPLISPNVLKAIFRVVSHGFSWYSSPRVTGARSARSGEVLCFVKPCQLGQLLSEARRGIKRALLLAPFFQSQHDLFGTAGLPNRPGGG